MCFGWRGNVIFKKILRLNPEVNWYFWKSELNFNILTRLVATQRTEYCSKSFTIVNQWLWKAATFATSVTRTNSWATCSANVIVYYAEVPDYIILSANSSHKFSKSSASPLGIAAKCQLRENHTRLAINQSKYELYSSTDVIYILKSNILYKMCCVIGRKIKKSYTDWTCSNFVTLCSSENISRRVLCCNAYQLYRFTYQEQTFQFSGI